MVAVGLVISRKNGQVFTAIESPAEMHPQPELQRVQPRRRPADAHLGGRLVDVVEQPTHDDGLHLRETLVTVDRLRPLLHAQLVIDVEVHRKTLRLHECEHLAAEVQRKRVVVQQAAGRHVADERSLVCAPPGRRGRVQRRSRPPS